MNSNTSVRKNSNHTTTKLVYETLKALLDNESVVFIYCGKNGHYILDPIWGHIRATTVNISTEFYYTEFRLNRTALQVILKDDDGSNHSVVTIFLRDIISFEEVPKNLY